MRVYPDGGAPVELAHRASGLFEAVLAGAPCRGYERRGRATTTYTVHGRDPYSFLPTLGELDLHLVGEGRHEALWERLGAHLREIDGAAGVAFAVWAPSARSVSVVGDWNGWDGRVHPMRSLGSSGIWELFVPGVGAGRPLQVRDPGRRRRACGSRPTRSPPRRRRRRARPRWCSSSHHEWRDAAWLARARRAPPARRAGVDLRGAPALVAARTRWRATAR